MAADALLTAHDWLESILGGHRPTEADVRELLKIHEGLHLDFKDGKLTQDKRKRNAVLREYASAFANSDGGLLVIGATNDEPRRLSPCDDIGGDVAEWAASALRDIAHVLRPPPRFHRVETNEGPVLLVAFARAPALVPAKDGGGWVFWLRFHDGNKQVPEYLLTDLSLGRREHPIFDVQTQADNPSIARAPNVGPHPGAMLEFEFLVNNDSLVFADDVELGVVGWTAQSDVRALPRYLRSFVDLDNNSGFEVELLPVCRSAPLVFTGAAGGLRPFQDAKAVQFGSFVVPIRRRTCGSFAVFITSRGHPPMWFEIQFTIANELHSGTYEQTVQNTRLRPVVGRRPIVAWRRHTAKMEAKPDGSAV